MDAIRAVDAFDGSGRRRERGTVSQTMAPSPLPRNNRRQLNRDQGGGPSATLRAAMLVLKKPWIRNTRQLSFTY